MRDRHVTAMAGAFLALVVVAGCSGPVASGGQATVGPASSGASATPSTTVTDAAAASSTSAEEDDYKTQVAPHLLHSTHDIDSQFQSLLASGPSSGPGLSAQIRQVALDPSTELRADASKLTGLGEPLDSVHGVFLASLDQKVARYTAFVDGASSGNKNDLVIAQQAAVQENADLRAWAQRVQSLP